ncbi:MAG: cupin domain-containing protein [Flavobacteriales bacterium]|nr:cupin domain-containing protein [Flavobacteriales bacterium]
MHRKRFLLSAVASVVAVLITKGQAVAMSITKGQAVAMSITKGFKVAAGATRHGERFTMKGVTANTLDLKIGSADTDGGMAVFEQIGQSPHGGPPLHIHPEQDESFHVLEGEYRFRVGDEQFPASVGDTIFLPRGVPHAFIQLTEHARMLVTYQPAGDMEAFFRKTAAWRTPPSKEEVARVFAAHGMRVVGPPLTLE